VTRGTFLEHVCPVVVVLVNDPTTKAGRVGSIPGRVMTKTSITIHAAPCSVRPRALGCFLSARVGFTHRVAIDSPPVQHSL